MKVHWNLYALILAMAAFGIVQQARAQNPNSASPDPLPSGYAKRPAGAAQGVSPANSPAPTDPAQATPDANTLAGAQILGLGYLQPSHNIFDPSLSLSEMGGTLQTQGGPTNLYYTTLAGGLLNLDHTQGHYHTIAMYTGGAYIARGSQYLNTQFHDATLIQEIDWQRWRLLLRDDFVATPGAVFTGTGLGGPGMITQMSTTIGSVLLNNIGQGFVPTETIQSGNAMRYMDAALGQVQFDISRRSTLTTAASYGLLHFATPGFIDSNKWTGQAGYDYQIDPADSIGFFGGAGHMDFPGTSTSIVNYLGALAFGRKITGRLAFQVAGGPEQIRLTASGASSQEWYEMATGSVDYERRRDGYSLTFLRGLTAGSGVLYGAKSNTVTLSAHRRFTRFWTGSVSGGYAQDSNLPVAGVPNFQFNDWFGGASIGRGLGRHVLINFNYGAQKQNSPANCPVTSCGLPGLQQTFGMTVSWHLRPAG